MGAKKKEKKVTVVICFISLTTTHYKIYKKLWEGKEFPFFTRELNYIHILYLYSTLMNNHCYLKIKNLNYYIGSRNVIYVIFYTIP